MTDIDFERLAEPFDYEDVEWRAGATNEAKDQALALAYITARAIMNRLDTICGPQNWRDQYEQGPDGGVLCGISLRVNGEWITKWDGAENSNIEAVKGGLSDSFKRAAVKWGIGRYLYKLDGVWTRCKAYGKTVKLLDNPKLPAWALPQGAKAQQQPAKLATGPNEPPAQKQHAPEPSPRERQLIAELTGEEPLNAPITYTGLTATVIKGGYKMPAPWCKALASAGFSSMYEVDGIMKKVRLPQNTPVENVVQRVRDWLAAKDAKVGSPDTFQDDEELEMSIDPSDGLPFGDK